MYQHISVPIEGTGDSGPAIASAIELARRERGTIDLVVVHPSPRQLEELAAAKAVVEAAGLTTTVTVLQGAVADVLADHVASSESDLIVMTPHDWNRVERLLLGNVTSQVVRRGGKPILMLPSGSKRDDGLGATRRILVTLDGSTFAEQILPHAERLAHRVGAELILLTVIQPMIAAAAAAGLGEPVLGLGAPVDALDTDQHAVARDRAHLEQVAARLRDRGLTVRTDVVVNGNVGRTIVGYVAANAIDLIAMSTNGRGGLERLVLGSVANEVLHAAKAPLLVIRPSDAKAADAAVSRPVQARADRVDEAGRESFPASDPPAWNALIPRAPGD